MAVELREIIYHTIHPMNNRLQLKGRVLNSGDNTIAAAPSGHFVKASRLVVQNPSTTSSAVLKLKDVYVYYAGTTPVTGTAVVDIIVVAPGAVVEYSNGPMFRQLIVESSLSGIVLTGTLEVY